MRATFQALGGILAVAVVAAAPAGHVTQHLKNLRVAEWHRAGHRGQGVKVAVLDTGFRGYTNSLGAGLPRSVTARSFRADGDLEARRSRHGVSCAEVIHALAPDAELLFADWQSDAPDSFVAAVTWAKRSGAKVLVCSVITPSWSDGEGGGSTHRKLSEVIGDDLLCIACAGNLAKRHWRGAVHTNPDGWHVWPDGSIDNVVTPWGRETVSLDLSTTGGSFEVIACDEGGKPVARTHILPGCCGGSCRFVAKYKARYSVRIRSQTGGEFHLTALGAWLSQHSVSGSVMFPADGASWLSVGAWEHNRRADYSSCGPNSRQQKPDLVAPVPFVPRDDALPFSGTSAAAPQAAGLAALYWSRHPRASAAEVRTALRAAAADVAAPGLDDDSGWGLLQMPSLR